jgi:predicted DNA-binding transcriptional regulator AlpA
MQENAITTPASGPEYLDRDQFATLIGMSTAFVRKLDRLNTGPERIRLGKCVRYSRLSVRDWIQSHTEAV